MVAVHAAIGTLNCYERNFTDANEAVDAGVHIYNPDTLHIPFPDYGVILTLGRQVDKLNSGWIYQFAFPTDGLNIYKRSAINPTSKPPTNWTNWSAICNTIKGDVSVENIAAWQSKSVGVYFGTPLPTGTYNVQLTCTVGGANWATCGYRISSKSQTGFVVDFYNASANILGQCTYNWLVTY